MNTLKIYLTSIEYTYFKKSSKSKKLKGGFVYGLVKAIDEREALLKVSLALKNSNINIMFVESIVPYARGTEWETREQTENFIQLFDDAELLNEVIFDTFYAYESE